MGIGLHMGIVNVIVTLSKAGRNHPLATYVITGFDASFTYAISSGGTKC